MNKLALIAGGLALGSTVTAQEKPNIILILALSLIHI